MKPSARDITAFLSAPPDAIQVFVIFGPDSGLVRERAETLCRALVTDINDPFAVTSLAEEDIKADRALLGDSMAELSLTGEQRLVRLRITADAPAFTSWLKAFDKEEIPAEARLVVQAHDLKKTSAIRKIIEPSKRCAAIACYAPSARDLISLAEDVFSQDGLSLDPDARPLLSSILEGQQAMARQEIEKLVLYKGPKEQRGSDVITISDIEAISVAGAEAQLDQVIDFTLLGEADISDRAYHQALDSGISAIGLLRVLQRRIDQLDNAQSAGGNDMAIRRTGAPAFGPAGDRFKRQLRVWTPNRLDHARRLSFETERQVKRTGAPVNQLVGTLLQRLVKGARA